MMPRFTVQKRDGSEQPFDIGKIVSAIRSAQHATCPSSSSSAAQLESVLLADITERLAASSPSTCLSITFIQDTVEQALMRHEGYAKVAKHYILYRSERDRLRDPESEVRKIARKCAPTLTTPWGPLGYVTFKRTYARLKGPQCPSQHTTRETEELGDTVERVLVACQEQLKVGFTYDELRTAYEYMVSLKFSVAGRFLWQLGTVTVDRLGLSSLQNCAFVRVDHPIRSFTWIFDMLMLGVGVGFNIQRATVAELPPLLDADIRVMRSDTKDADFIVPDSREGWVSLLERTLEAFFYRGKSFTYSTILVRGAGSPIHGFGGVASGPEGLCLGIEQLSGILRRRRGGRLTTVDCLDLVDIIASVVVAGNIRRSALISIGDHDDVEYLRAKRWDLPDENIPNWRCMSNNSVICSDTRELPDEFWEGYMGNGEPYGLINLDLARRVGRTTDGSKYPDPDVQGFNPCAEQGLANFETCCLSELFLPNLATFDEARTAATLAYRICKHSLLLPCHQPETQAVVRRNMRMGIGITGYMQATDEQRAWLPGLYEYLREYDKAYSAKHGMCESVKLTTTKPSGTLSLLAGVTPGAHPAIYRYFIRRIRIAASNRLAAVCRAHGYPCEYQLNYDGTEDRHTVVVSFPCSFPAHSRFAKDMSAIDQLEVVKSLQHDWSDNAVSVTVYYRKEELPAIRQWLADNYATCLKTVSFLLHNDHGFKQAPYEEITREAYERLVQSTRPITNEATIVAADDEDDRLCLADNEECASGACPVK